jgi:hypothetical protein
MSKIRVLVTREYQVDLDAWADEYGAVRGLDVLADVENYLGDRSVGDSDFPEYHDSDITTQVSRTVAVGDGPRLMSVPIGAAEYAVNRLALALGTRPGHRYPGDLLEQVLTDLGIRLVTE